MVAISYRQQNPVRLKLTMLRDGCWRSLQHVLCQIDEDLVELAATQQVEVLNNLQDNTKHQCLSL